jgi:hypothetical protein
LTFNVVGCGGSKPQAEQANSETQSSDTKAAGHGVDVTMPEWEEAEPEAGNDGTKKEEPKQSEPEKAVRRPQPTFSNEQEIATTIGESGAVMKVGTAVLRIPEGALRDGKNVRFALSTASPSKGAPPRIGQSFTLEPKLKSAGPAFEITLSLPDGANAVDLVVATAQSSPKIPYRKISPKQVDAKKRQALFELEELPGADVYLTARTEPAASAQAPAPAK